MAYWALGADLAKGGPLYPRLTWNACAFVYDQAWSFSEELRMKLYVHVALNTIV